MRKTWTIGAVALLAGILMMPNYQAVARGGGGFHGGGFHGGFGGGGFRGGGFGGFRGGGFGRSADSVGALDVSAVVDSDVVSDSTVGMVGTGVITPTTTDAIFSISPGIRRRHRFVSAAIHRQVSEITPPAQSDRRGTRLPF